ncbi:hypothetical protein GRF29_154g115386 [Pseudopithomyces chartarum]|uniref:Major facilitator superfamily (MFS) profile domain-containing protein n=1 Tax=Pseudopithomyces chartarum TaxID=1892770 RepID=A0AAN6LT25_9PLEO|nr:hypothetical protein GRF29_154g115386 [Pseudopithomyces chartarum]
MATPTELAEAKYVIETTATPYTEKDQISGDHSNEDADQTVDTDFQKGVQEIEAVTIVWSKGSMIAAFAMMWIIYFVQGLAGSVGGALLPYVTSAFAMHSLTATTGVVSAIIGGISNLSIAKILDVFGRPQGFFIAAVIATIGLIMSAACTNVEMYSASQVFYTIGMNGIGYSMSVFIADSTTLHNRGLVQALTSSPGMITVWIGGPISTAFLAGSGWRWAFGMLSILVPAVTAPLFVLFTYRFIQAKRRGLVPACDSGRTTLQSLHYYAQEFDLIGLICLSAGVAFFLLPFNLYTQQAKGWGSALTISFLVVGIVLLIAFAPWERFGAKKSLVPWALLKDRTVLGASLASFTLFLSYGCWNAYFTSILQVVNNLSVSDASYIMAGYTVCSTISAILTGVVMSITGRFKAITLYVSLPLMILGTGLLIHFRRPDGKVGYVVMSVLFMAAGSGISTMTIEIAILAAMKTQQFFAIAIALVSTTGSIGLAVGLTISSAIWQQTFPTRLAAYLPEEDMPNYVMIYADITMQLAYPPGTPTRLAIQKAYGDSQKYLFIAATCAWALAVVGTLMWKDINIKVMKQTKGRVI